jgi:cyclohexadienyl dehydratase
MSSIRNLLALLLLAWGAAAAAETAPVGRLERVRAAGVLRVCIWPDYYSITFRNPKSGDLSGIDVELSAAFAKDLGVKVSYVDSSFPAFIGDLLGDRCDIAMFGVGMLPERAARIRFSQPYLRSDIYAVTTRTHPAVKSWDDIDKPGRVVAVQAGTFMAPAVHPGEGSAVRTCRRLHDRLPVQPARPRQRRLGPGHAARPADLSALLRLRGRPG